MKAPQMMFSGLWRVDGNFQSTIHMKNSLVVAPVQVTPVLCMADGTEMLDLDQLTLGLPGLENQAGGIRVQWQGSAADLAVTGGLEDAREGFSSNMQFWSHDLMAAPAPSTMAAVGMMTGEADPSLGYPAGTRFTPYVVLRNSTSRALSVKLVVHETSGTQSFSLPLVLKPLETIRVDIRKAQVAAGRREQFKTMIPMRRLGRPEEIAAAAVFLASDESSFITGIDLPVDGGVVAV
jgi:hypothetical protein